MCNSDGRKVTNFSTIVYFFLAELHCVVASERRYKILTQARPSAPLTDKDIANNDNRCLPYRFERCTINRLWHFLSRLQKAVHRSSLGNFWFTSDSYTLGKRGKRRNPDNSEKPTANWISAFCTFSRHHERNPFEREI